jgi:hypothetical protein
MRLHISGTHYTFSQIKALVGTWYKNLYRLSFPILPFAEGFSCKRPLGDRESYLFFSRKISALTFSRLISLRYVNAVQLGKGISKGFPNLQIKVDCCLSDDSFWTTSQTLFTLDCVPDEELCSI